MTLRIPQLRAIASHPGVALISAALVCVGCAAPVARDSHVPSGIVPATRPANATPNRLQPTPSPTPKPRPDRSTNVGGNDIASDQMVKVLVTDLVLRSLPGTVPESTIYPDRLGAEMRAWVLEGPVTESGYEWYRVFVLDEMPRPDAERVGWIAAASRDGEAWIAPTSVVCPSQPDFEALATLNQGEKIMCLSGRSLEVEGWIPPIWGSGGCGQEAPSWLLCWLAQTPLVSVQPPAGALEDPQYDPTWDDTAMLIHVNHPPNTDRPPLSPGLHLRVVGHVDDPVAETCGNGDYSVNPPVVVPDPVLVLWCRASFVADMVEILDE